MRWVSWSQLGHSTLYGTDHHVPRIRPITDRVPRIKELKLTAALYASRPGVLEHVRSTGRLPVNINMGGGCIGLHLLIESRGPDIDLTPDEELVYDAIIRERRWPGGRAILVEPEFTPAPPDRGKR